MILIAKFLIVLGFLFLSFGYILLYFPQFFSWFSNMPGDINCNTDNIKISIPFGSMLIASIILSIIINLIIRITR